MIPKYPVSRVSVIAIVAAWSAACGGAGDLGEDTSETGSALSWMPVAAKPVLTAGPTLTAQPTPPAPPTETPQPPVTGPIPAYASGPIGCATQDGSVQLPDGTSASLAQDNHWFDGIVSFRFHSSVAPGSAAETALLQAMRHYNFMTSVRFVFDANNTQSDHVLFRTDEVGAGCVSRGIGFQGGTHIVNLETAGCQTFNVAVHEIGHRVGLHHEQRRADRDKYILVQDGGLHDGVRTNKNIHANRLSQFAIYQGPGYQVGGFDFDSVMLYPSTTGDDTFAIDTSMPIITRRDGTIYDNPQSSTTSPLTSGLSNGDIATLFQLYPPPGLVANTDNTCRTAPVKASLPKRASALVAAWDAGGTAAFSQYNSTGSAFKAPASWGVGGGFQSHAPWAAGDFNGDGLTDTAEIQNAGGLSRVVVRTARETGFAAPASWVDRAGKFERSRQWLPGDFNRDTRDDLAVVWRDGSRTTISVFVSTGSGFTGPMLGSIQDGDFEPHAHWTVGDFNNDGFADLAAAWNDGGYNSITVRLSTGSGFNKQDWAIRKGAFGYFNKWLAGDFSGDGVTDLVEIRKQGTSTIARVFTSLGSGFSEPTDWLSFGEGGGLPVTGTFTTARQINNGPGTTPPVVVIDDPPATDTSRWSAGDFNNDGRADLARVSSNGSSTGITVLLSNGSSFSKATWSNATGTYPTSTQWCAGRFGNLTSVSDGVLDHAMQAVRTQ